MDSKTRGQAAGPAVGESSFDAYYFEHCCGRPYTRDEHWTAFFGAIADQIVAGIRPQRVLDAGCALGLLVEALRTRGVDAEGIDLSSYAIEHAHESVSGFVRQASITTEFTGRYDLIVTIEVLEHLNARDGEAAIANICRHTDDVLFSSTPTDYRETSHVNVQPPEYWAEQFARHGFYRDVEFDASFVTPWTIRFRRSTEPLPRIVRDYERQYWAMAVERNGLRGFLIELQRDRAQALERAAQMADDVARAAADRQELDARRAAAAAAEAALSSEGTAHETTRAELARTLDTLNAAEAENAELREAQKELLALRCAQVELVTLRAALDETHRHLTRKVVALQGAEEQAAVLHAALGAAEHDREHARATIRNMEGSVFWRLRRVWARLSRLAGRPT